MKFIKNFVRCKTAEEVFHKYKLFENDPGHRSMIIDLKDISPDEDRLVREHLGLPPKEPDSVRGGEISTFPVMPVPAPVPVIGQCPPPLALAMQAASSPPRKGSFSPYHLMNKVLFSCCLRRYNGEIYLFKGGVFRRLSKEELNELIFLILEPEIAGGSGPQVVSEVARLISMNAHIKADWTTDTSVRFFFRNGAYNVTTNTLEQLTRGDFFTSYIDCEYPTEPVVCPAFDRFLESVAQGDELIVKALWEMIGYLIVPYDLSGKVFFVLQGSGNTGKSVLGNLIASFFNEEAVSYLSIFRFKDRFSTSALEGKRLNISMDLPNERISKEAIGTLKMITGRDRITVEAKFKDPKAHVPTVKLLFGTNFPLLVADKDEAFFRRMVILPFQHPVPEDQQDKDLLQKLMLERPAIAARALSAYRDLVRRNYEFIRPGGAAVFGCPPMAEVILNFLSRYCLMDETAFTPTAELQIAFNSYCSEIGLPGIEDRSMFSRQINAACAGRTQAKKHRVRGVPMNCINGLALKGSYK